MEFDPVRFDYPSRRNVVYARKGMVATSQQLAAQAGLDMLKKGGTQLTRHCRRSLPYGGGAHLQRYRRRCLCHCLDGWEAVWP